jgi:hypothetical protein
MHAYSSQEEDDASQEEDHKATEIDLRPHLALQKVAPQF